MSDPTDPFEVWWSREGSFPPNPGEDHEEHLYRVSKVAWSNGAFVAARERDEASCTWAYDRHDGCFATSCGQYFEITNEAGLKGNYFNFCHHCGKRIDEAQPSDEEE